MAAQATARASPELREAPLSPRYSRNYTTSRGTTLPELQDYVSRIQAVSEAHDIFAPYQNAG